jgi:hypothetical protein
VPRSSVTDGGVDGSVAERGALEIVATYRFPHEASLAKSALEAFGVDAWVLDETQIRLRWYMGAALGGVKLAVRAGDAATAREILDGDHSADLAGIPEAKLPPSPGELCPRCGADALERVKGRTSGDVLRRMLLLVLALFLGSHAPHDRLTRAWRCRACGLQ